MRPAVSTFVTDLTQRLTNPSHLVSKFTPPFAQRKKNSAEHFIQLKEPHKRYSPGDRVEGSVVVNVTKPIRVTHLLVRLHGFVKVYNSPRVPGRSGPRDGGILPSGMGKRGCEYFGNGFASLFENETALCGEGRLEAGTFEFEFVLEFPPEGLPSSIDFERGTISYLITSTLTRPTTISPVSTCERQISLMEAIDIAPVPLPNPCSITVEMLSRKSITKLTSKKAINSSIGDKTHSSSSMTARSSRSSSHQAVPQASNQSPQSASPVEPRIATPPTSDSSESPRREHFVPDQMVKAMVKVLQGGCLPGGRLKIEISINHAKQIKNLQGIIITLYREGHVDTHPAIPLGPSSKSKKQYEDYYPKSRTGLGGLSLSSAGSSSLFRKDLSQKIVPLIINPWSLNALIKASLQVPEDVFPTISCVPGAMISFRYFVEVVIDLRGKPLNQDRFLPRLNMTSGTSKFEYSDQVADRLNETDGLVIPSPAPLAFVVTEHIRREKGVVASLFEVIVGTKDSVRGQSRLWDGRHMVDDHSTDWQAHSSEARRAENSSDIINNSTTAAGNLPVNPDYRLIAHDHEGRDSVAYGTEPLPPDAISPAPVDGNLDEKARIRLAEERLLPGAPPPHDESSIFHHLQPSAPEPFEEDYYLPSIWNIESNNEQPGPSLLSVKIDDGLDYKHGKYRPTQFSSRTEYGDDKQELERKRLLLLASSPSGVQAQDATESYEEMHQARQPTAPPLEELIPDHQPDNRRRSTSLSSSESPRVAEDLPVYEK